MEKREKDSGKDDLINKNKKKKTRNLILGL